MRSPATRPDPDDTDAERQLCIAVLKRAWADARSPLPWIRRAALAFWQHPDDLQFFDDLLNLDGALLRQAATLSTGGELEAASLQLTLF